MTQSITNQSKFRTGQLVTTCGVNADMTANAAFAIFVAKSLRLHANGNWGDCDHEDASLNDQALIPGNEGRIFSVYNLPEDLAGFTGESRIWIITEWDRSATTVLYPSEY